MRQVVDNHGNPIQGLYKNDDGSIVVKDDAALHINKSQHGALGSINNEIVLLKKQVEQLIGLLNDKHSL